ncbi:MAG: hypothetical protein D6706_09265 [Chloroflexi bacterium]|nr:MAG: hypothetical protein D6706_09265 [Chloroflexota bacterium]
MNVHMKRWQLFGTLWIVLWSLLGLTGCRTANVVAETAVSPTASPTSLTILAPDTITAGEPVEVVVRSDGLADNTAVSLMLIGSYGTQLFQSEAIDETAVFHIPGQATTRSGLTTLIAIANTTRTHSQLHIQPDHPVEPITPLVGAHTIIADGSHWSMTVTVPFDRFGNPVAEGTPVTIRAQHPGKWLEEKNIPIEHLLAWVRIYSGTKAGITTITAQIKGNENWPTVNGPAKELREIPGWPVPFTVTTEEDQIPADGFHLVTLRTSTIQDAFGNIMPDGTQVMFVVTEPDGQPRLIPAYTLDGIAEAPLQSPLEPGTVVVRGSVYGVESPPLTLTFTDGPAVNDFPVHIRLDEASGAVYLEAGPLLGALGAYVPDGTPVRFQVYGTNGQLVAEKTAVSDAGYATAELRLFRLASGHYQARVSAGSGQGQVKFTIP